MAQETAASVMAPEGPIWRAWLDAFIHPKFETYASWYLRMNARWRRISLMVSLGLLLVADFVVIAHDAADIGGHIQALTGNRFQSYLGSPHGRFELFALFAGAVATIFAIPATTALIAHRSLGRYRIRYYIAYCTFMQTLLVACVFLILGAAGHLVFGAFDFDSDSFIGLAAGFVLVYLPIYMAWGLGCVGLCAATLRDIRLIWLVTLAVYVIIVSLVWHLLGHILISLGYPVL